MLWAQWTLLVLYCLAFIGTVSNARKEKTDRGAFILAVMFLLTVLITYLAGGFSQIIGGPTP